jgi:hypothetical protein
MSGEEHRDISSRDGEYEGGERNEVRVESQRRTDLILLAWQRAQREVAFADELASLRGDLSPDGDEFDVTTPQDFALYPRLGVKELVVLKRGAFVQYVVELEMLASSRI